MNTVLSNSSLSFKCAQCLERGVPPDSLRSLVIGHQLICGNCGNVTPKEWTVSVPSPVAAILCSLIQHGLFRIAADITSVPAEAGKQQLSDQYSLLLARDDASTIQAACTVSWRFMARDRKKESLRRKYARDRILIHQDCNASSPVVDSVDIRCFVPQRVHQACQLISDSDGGAWAAMRCTDANVTRERKTIRFERYVYLTDHNNVIDNHRHLQIRLEVAWSVPEVQQTIFVPVFSSEQALRLLTNGFGHEDIELQPVAVCLNRSTAESIIRRGAAQEAKEAYLLMLNCNGCEVSAAVREYLDLGYGDGDSGKTEFLLKPGSGAALMELLKRTESRDFHLERMPLHQQEDRR